MPRGAETREPHLERLGFTVIDLVTPEQARALLDMAGSRGRAPAHFRHDLDLEDNDERAERSNLLAAALDAPLRTAIGGVRPTLRTLRLLEPYGGQVPLGRGATRVDERGGERSLVAWIPLQDVTGHDGQLRVVPGSHRLPPTLRGPGLDATLPPPEDVEPFLRTVPLRAGQALVMDAALIHGTFPNHTAGPRWWATIELVPEHAEVLLVQRIDDGHALLERVRDGFWTTLTSADLARPRPQPPVRRVRPAPALELSASDVAAAASAATAPRWRRGRTQHAPAPPSSSAVLRPAPVDAALLSAELQSLVPPGAFEDAAPACLTLPLIVDGQPIAGRSPAAVAACEALGDVRHARYLLLGASTILEPDASGPSAGSLVHVPVAGPTEGPRCGIERADGSFDPFVAGRPLVTAPGEAVRLIDFAPTPWFLLQAEVVAPGS